MTVAIQERKAFEISISEVKQSCCKAFDCREEDFDNWALSGSAICKARYAYYVILRKTKVITLNDIGIPFRRSKDCVSKGMKQFNGLLNKNEIIADTFRSIGNDLGCPKIINEIIKEAQNGK